MLPKKFVSTSGSSCLTDGISQLTPLIELGDSATATYDLGFYGQYNGGYAGLIMDNSDSDTFKLFAGAIAEPNASTFIVPEITVPNFANLDMGPNLKLQALDAANRDVEIALHRYTGSQEKIGVFGFDHGTGDIEIGSVLDNAGAVSSWGVKFLSNGYTASMYLTNDGDFGIGTTTPTSTLDIVSDYHSTSGTFVIGASNKNIGLE